MTKDAPKVAVGQTWKDKDKREPFRRVKVTAIVDGKAVIAPVGGGGRPTKVRLDRLPKAFALVEDVRSQVSGLVDDATPPPASKLVLRPVAYEHQRLFFVTFQPKDDRPVRIAVPFAVPFEERDVAAVWTLYRATDQASPPALPFYPQHHVNAFREDYIHDWNIFQGHFHYRSRITDEPVWILVDLKKDV